MSIPSKNRVEWAVFGLGLLLLAIVVGYLVYDMTTAGDAPARLSVTLGEAELIGDHYMVPVTVENAGDRSAENVYVEVTLTGGAEVVRSTVELAFVPRGSSADGWVAFLEEPAPERLRTRVVGYEEP